MGLTFANENYISVDGAYVPRMNRSGSEKEQIFSEDRSSGSRNFRAGGLKSGRGVKNTKQ